MVLATLPRVIGPTEKVKLPVTIFAMDANIKDVTVEVQTNDLFMIKGESKKKISFEKEGDMNINFENTVHVDGTFYIGILQYNQYLLNVGLDISQSHKGNLLYNLGSDWNVSGAPGNLMFRPYVMRSYSSAQDQIHNQMSVILYPNPVSAALNFKFPDSVFEGDVKINVYNISP